MKQLPTQTQQQYFSDHQSAIRIHPQELSRESEQTQQWLQQKAKVVV